ncbi:hypothetical protein [Streptomyces cinerochromogenes]|uniref:hypothetical protein n=1 Tax=Streptomyces cinerochromogenes TaxID=66422 RepID=UPI0016715CEE|nr:hypothetical protein [Streptomyces cinerochromogenes]GGS65227.1 hypothetical protein GCM10010206_29640 [Streptomyces cinerochromogenes]
MARRSLICAGVSVLLALSPALATAAAADDSGDPQVRELGHEAERNLRDADSLRLTLTDRTASGSRDKLAWMDMFLDRRGNCVASFRMGGNGGTFDLVKRGDEVWMKADWDYWKSQLPGENETADLVRNRWVHGTTDESAFKDFTGACDLKAFQEDITVDVTSNEGRSTVDGTDVYRLSGEEEGIPTTVYITVDSPHLLIRSDQKGDGTDRTAGVSDYNEPVPSGTPGPRDSVDLSDLEQESGQSG